MRSRAGLKSYDAWPGLKYDSKRKYAVLEGYVAGSNSKLRRQKTLKNVTIDEACAQWKAFRAELDRGAAEERPRTIAQFVEQHYKTISKRHAESTKRTHTAIIKNHLKRFFKDLPMAMITAAGQFSLVLGPSHHSTG